MELTALLELLRAVPTDVELVVFADSKYVIDAVTKWRFGWKKRGWCKADGSPIANPELFRAIDEVMVGRTVRFEWVRGHAGHGMNECADIYARAAATAQQAGRPAESGPGFTV